jgi:hypothetical protein
VLAKKQGAGFGMRKVTIIAKNVNYKEKQLNSCFPAKNMPLNICMLLLFSAFSHARLSL